jgi:hypothetical protein
VAHYTINQSLLRSRSTAKYKDALTGESVLRKSSRARKTKSYADMNNEVGLMLLSFMHTLGFSLLVFNARLLLVIKKSCVDMNNEVGLMVLSLLFLFAFVCAR